MRIGLVLDDSLDTPDGVQQYVLGIGAWLSEQGHEVHYLVGQTTRTDRAHIHSLTRNLAVRFNGNSLSIPLPTSTTALRALLHELQLDVLHVQVPYSPFLAGKLLRLVSPQTAVTGTFHILPFSRSVRLANRGLAFLNRRSGRRFDQMIAVSAPAQAFAEHVYGYKSIVVPNVLRLRQFSIDPDSDSALNIVFLGRLVPRKGALLLLKAVAYIQAHHLYEGEYHVYIGGKGQLLSHLQQYVIDNTLESIVSFDGFVAEEDKARYLSKADIAVFPSTGGESFGISLLEGLAAARGVVLAGNNPGYASVMPNAHQLFDPTDTANFAVALVDWLANVQERQAVAARQKEYVQQFDIETVGRRLEAVYDQALQKRVKS